jgi:hypothetical protein
MAQKARYNNDMHEEAELLGFLNQKGFYYYGVIVFAVSSVLFWLLGNAHQALAASIVSP